MKPFIRAGAITLIGLAVAIFLYPFLHEMGHLVAVMLSGARPQELRLFPLPYVSCDLSAVGRLSRCFVGLFGMLFPLLVSFLIRKRVFWLWLIAFLLKGISMLSFAISAVAMLFCHHGGVWAREDIVRVAGIWEPFSGFWAFWMLALVAFCGVDLYLQHPIRRLKEGCGVG